MQSLSFKGEIRKLVLVEMCSESSWGPPDGCVEQAGNFSVLDTKRILVFSSTRLPTLKFLKEDFESSSLYQKGRVD